MDHNVIEHTSAVTIGKSLTASGSLISVGTGVAFTEIELKAIGVFSGIVIGVIGLMITYYFQHKNYKLNEQKALKSGDWDGIERRLDERSENVVYSNKQFGNVAANRRQGYPKKR